MRILIASDLHGSISSLRFIVNHAASLQPDMLVLLGDLVYHGPRNPLPYAYDTRSVLRDLPDLAWLPCPLVAVRGNCDAEVDVDQMPFRMTEDAWINADNFNIYACHGHHIPANPPIPDIESGTIVLRGHTHIPRAETIDGVHFWNPGSLSLPKGGFPPSYGWYENGKFTVFDTQGHTLMTHQPPN